ncbi:TetR/AcrR family transcriptional regulator [Acinetobacter puyangensis]|uniref:Transcriptional regulator, TetR family n=1 Tax=Acinetobacter puyangensis TaxID=1096779 RepID=A0A240E5S2_9GAMM|nr:TetR/AcrR family transcriptional regulator [Acinetobacter puyangensis]SNX43871.1 transcriptional regulator, TetR family [Acinetobacter puyangensis]
MGLNSEIDINRDHQNHSSDISISVSQRKRRKEARPQEIIEAAFRIFSVHGYAAATMMQIAKEAGVAKGTLFLYFPTKEALFRAVIHAFSKQYRLNLEQISDQSEVSVEQCLQAVLLETARQLQDPKTTALIRLMLAEATTFPDLAATWHEEMTDKVWKAFDQLFLNTWGGSNNNIDLYRFVLTGPLISAMLYRMLFQHLPVAMPDLEQLAKQYTHILLSAMQNIQLSDTE